MENINWSKVLVKIIEGEKHIPSPFHPNGILNYLFVIHDRTSRMGYLLAWCSITKKGFHFSRLKVPNDAEFFIFSDEIIDKADLPEIELQDIDFSKS